MGFQKDFIWGAATASYQVEGAAFEDGRGPSIWDMTRRPGTVMHGENGDVAADEYHHVDEDVALLKQMGVNTYRFSISWSRVLPEGTGKVNEAGLEYYSRLTDKLLEAGIQPMITLFHWDLPYALYLRGGYANPEFPDWFADYTKVVVDRLSDRVRYWITMNEPQCVFGNGFWTGTHAPFLKCDDHTILIMVHHYLLAHGRAVETIRANAKLKPVVGIAPMAPVFCPGNDSPEEVEKARKRTFSLVERFYSKTLYSDPMIFGRYPEDAEETFGKAMIHPSQEDMKQIAQPLDFYGMNVYFSDALQNPEGYAENEYQGVPRTQLGWVIDERAAYWSAKFIYERYHLPLIMTENGAAITDVVSLDGKVHDPQRIDYMHRYLRAFRQAADEGIPIHGYIYWSAFDNYEWNQGYDYRFGLTYVDYRTQKRILKDSALWYRTVIETNGDAL